MRQVFFNPVVLLIIAMIGIIYLLLFSSWVTRKENDRSLRWAITFLFLFTGLNLSIFPFSYIYPETLAGFDKTLDSAFVQLSIYFCIALVLRVWLRDFLKNILYLGKSPFLSILLIFTLLSAFWSETPDLSLRFSLVVFFTSLFAVHVAREYNFKDLSAMLRRLTVVVAVTSLGLAMIAPSLASNDKGLMGIMPFPIKLGTFLAFGATLWFTYAQDNPKDRWKAIGIVLFLSLIITRTNSGQAIITYLVLFLLVILLQVLKVSCSKYFPVIVIGYLIFGILSSIVLNVILPIIFDTLGKDTTLTGRTEFWPQLIDRLGQHNLLLGYGMNSFWQPWRRVADPANGILNSNGFIPPHAHNGFLDLALSVGLIGFVLFVISFLIALLQSIQYFLKNNSADSKLPLIILIYVVFSNISETQLIGANYIWILYVITLTRLNIKDAKFAIPAKVTQPSRYTLS